jgi:glutathione S-transferase
MYRLYHHPLDPLCRKLRLLLAEKEIACETISEDVWERRPEFLLLNPAGEVPVLVAVEGGSERIFADSTAIAEYLEEMQPRPTLIGTTPEDRAEVRRLVGWFERKFYDEVGRCLVDEKIFKRLAGRGGPDSTLLRAGYSNIHYHLDYIGYLSERRNWLAGAELTLADLAAAAQLSAVDYLGDVPWAQHPAAQDWYARLKSRPAFRGLLGDRLAGLPPARHYADLDF